MSVNEVVLTEDELAVRKTMDDIIAAWNANDGDAFAELHGEEASLVTVEGIYCKGREQIRGTMRMLYSSVFKGSKLFMEPEDIWFLSENVALGVFWNAILLGGLAELPPEETRRATWAFRRNADGQWLIEAFQNVFITEPTLEAGPPAS